MLNLSVLKCRTGQLFVDTESRACYDCFRDSCSELRPQTRYIVHKLIKIPFVEVECQKKPERRKMPSRERQCNKNIMTTA